MPPLKLKRINWMGKAMTSRSLFAAVAAMSGTVLLGGCYYSHTTEVPAPQPATAAAPVGCYYSNVPYSVGSRVVTPQVRTIECGRDGYWHVVQ
jgi:hypothetical protein